MAQGVIFNILLIFLLILLILIVNFIYFNFKNIKNPFRKIKKKTWIYLLLIFLIGFILRFFIVSHMHNLYYDEDAYLDIAKNIAENSNNCLCLYNNDGCKFCGYSYKSIGFSFILAIFFKIFGVSHAVGYNVIALFGSLSIILIFFFAYLLFKKEKIALLSALILALYPLHLRWSGSVSAEIVSLFFILLTFMFLLIYLENNKNISFLLAILTLLFTIMIKEENLILLVFFLIPMLYNKIHRKKSVFVIFLFLILLLPYIIGNIVFHNQPSSSENRYTFWKQGSIFSYYLFKKDVLQDLKFFINPAYTLLVVIIFSFVGMLFMLKNEKKLFFLLFLALIIIPLIFAAYIGKPLELSEVRHVIPVLLPIITFSSYGMYHLSNLSFLKKIRLYYIITAIILMSSVLYFPYLTSNKSPILNVQQDHDFLMSNLEDIPKNCLILTQESYILDFYNRKSASIFILDKINLTESCIYYYESELCYRQEGIKACQDIKDNFDLKLYKTNNRHSFYEVLNN